MSVASSSFLFLSSYFSPFLYDLYNFMWFIKLKVWIGMYRCLWVCDMWVCTDVQVGVAVGGLTIMNFLNTSWRLESKCQWPLIHILYDFFFSFFIEHKPWNCEEGVVFLSLKNLLHFYFCNCKVARRSCK